MLFRESNFQQAHRRPRTESARSNLGRQKQHSAFPHRVGKAAMKYIPNAFQTYQHSRLIHGSNVERQLPAKTPQSEMIAIKKPLPANRRNGNSDRRNQARNVLSEIDAVDCFVNLKRSRFASRGVHAIPVVQPKRHVAVLLNLEHDDPASQCVNGTCRQ